jgi:hypothetical protein
MDLDDTLNTYDPSITPTITVSHRDGWSDRLQGSRPENALDRNHDVCYAKIL